MSTDETAAPATAEDVLIRNDKDLKPARATIRAALLDAPAASGRGKYTGVIDELPDESALTENHVPEITQCDLPAGVYIWEPERKSFTHEQTVAARSAPSIERAVEALAVTVEALGARLPEEVTAWINVVHARRAAALDKARE